jgi:DNA-binding SARP family transcriptional activator
MAAPAVRIQICGPIAVEVNGVRREEQLPGPQGRRAVAYFVVHRNEPIARESLVDALWEPGAAVSESTVDALVSKIRRILPVVVRGGQLRLDLPADTWVDLEAARDAMHRAESAAAQEQWGRAWGAAQTALFTARRGFSPGVHAPWVDAVQHELQVLRERALEVYAAAALHIGRTELPTAERASRELIGLAPFRESGHCLLMRSLADGGNLAEALRVYDDLRCRLRDELGIDPSPQTRALHVELLTQASSAR